MATIPTLVQTHQLKTGLLRTLSKSHAVQLTVDYDRHFDAFMFLIAPNDKELIAHYVDGNVALLYQAETLEVVGLQIEAFERNFLASHDTVRRIWKLSDTGEKLENLGDVLFAIERLKPQMAREIVKATEDMLGDPGVDLVAALS